MPSPRIRQVFARFLLSGFVNTAATYLLYLLLLYVMPYWASYAIAFIAGIGIAYALNRLYVFGAPRSERRAALLPIVYVLQYLIGALVAFAWVDVFHFAEQVAPLISLSFTIPMTFFASRWLFSR